MSDDISIPNPTYRVPRHSRGIDPTTRKLALFAAGFGGTLLLAVGGWTALTHHSHGVPVVQADSGPLRVKPANPGGLQVAGAGNEIFSGGSDTDVEKLAPPAETPDPQGLRATTPPAPAAGTVSRVAESPPHAPAAVAAPPPQEPAHARPTETLPPAAAQIVAALKPGNAAVAPPARPAEPVVARSAEAPASRSVEAPASRPAEMSVARASEAPVARPKETPAAASDHGVAGRGPSVQIAAVASEQAARAEWERIAKRWPDLFGGRHPAFSKIEHGGHVFWRVRTGGFGDVAQATVFCERLRAKGGGCSVADF